MEGMQDSSSSLAQDPSFCSDWVTFSDQNIIRFPIMMQNVGSETITSPTGNNNETYPLQMLVQGIEQTVEIPLQSILTEVMKRMPAKEPATFRCAKLGDCRYQASVDLNVSGSRVTVEPETGVARLLGDISPSQDISMLSAVKRAFYYLEAKHSVQVNDYSTNVIEGYDCKCVFGDVNSVSYNLSKVLGDWSVVIDKIGMFHAELGRKDDIETSHGVRTDAGVIYAQAKDFVHLLFSKYHDKHNAKYLEFSVIEGKRSKYLSDVDDKIQKYRMKGYRQFLHFNEKDVLSCLLNLLELKPAEFSNTPVGRGEFRGEVIIDIPDIEEASYGGRTRFSGGVRTSAAEAEEHATYKALRYMERYLKLTIVDMNYGERVEAEKNHKFMVKLLRSVVGLAHSSLDDWSNMCESINEGGYMYSGDCLNPLSNAEVAAWKFCKDGFSKIEDDCKDAYQAAMTKMKCLEKYKQSGLESDN